MRQVFAAFAVAFFLITFHVSAQEEMVRVKINNEISLKVPKSFSPMTEGEMRNKFMTYRTPIAMFTSQDRMADLGINTNSSPWVDNDLSILKEFYKANIQNLFTEVRFIQDEIVNISGRDFAILEFVSKLSDEESTYGGLNKPVSKYSYIAYTIYNNSVLLFNFSSDAFGRNKWQVPASEIIQSIRIKE